jgi:flagellar motor switch protein FliM
MQNELNQEEIDAMVRAARTGGRADSGKAREPHVEPWDVRRAGQIGREQLAAITHLHEGFARSLTNALGTYLRVVFSATLVSAEHLSYREFTERIPETTYLAACKLEPMGVHGALQLDLKVAFPILDLLLGGEGKGLATPREITEIEDPIVESVARIVCRELGTAWHAVKLEVGFEKRLELAEAHRLMSPNEKILSLSFEVSLLEVRGGLNLAVPVSLSHALLRKISGERMDARPRGPSEWRDRLKRRLLQCSFPVELAARGLSVTVGELAEMAVGTLLPLRRSVAEPGSLIVGGVEMFAAGSARVTDLRAAQVMDAVVESELPSRELEVKQP